ncbi:mevalonate kinase [Lentilactobacillus sp. SPB1-3]|uniref:Mevalonate kinase n=1 Tax=Lentilactobacillus terminaliae TaxID=3003483 RepID=A0ACD5DC81_9LACO|nr:mevalonate kinase [Lentilactobacillus sp. SPB1-3]MCZ0977226.1 mevalonate kinase [Lentilactobacillus sp. SPB1-3]
MKTTVSANSFAKIILFGEHSVVYGHPAIALPLYSVNVTATIIPAESGQWIRSRYFDGQIAQLGENLLGIKRLIAWILTDLNQTSSSFTIQIESKIPAERGMGSSAATAVAITRALYKYFDKTITRDTLLQIANVEEQVTHGNPSGIDTATVSSEYPIWFVKHQENEQIAFNLTSDYLVIADSGIKGKTSEAVNLIADNLITDANEMQPLIDDLGKIALQGKTALQQADSKLVGHLMTTSHHHLQQLGVSTPTLDKFVDLAIANGAYGAKLTGSGMGGCMIALVDSNKQAHELASVLQDAGATSTWIQSFKNYGHTTGDSDDNIS